MTITHANHDGVISMIDGLENDLYDIGGVRVRMTPAQAASWNDGEPDRQTLRGAYVLIELSADDRPEPRALWPFAHGDHPAAKAMHGATAVRIGP